MSAVNFTPSVSALVFGSNILNKKRVILGHSYWGRGGAEIAAMWVLQALRNEYQLDIATRGGWDLDDLNRCSGTQILRNDLGAVLYPPLIPRQNARGGALWHGLYLRYCRHVGPNYDLCITASRVTDWGVAAIHFLSDVAWNKPLQERFGTAETCAREGILKKSYWRTAELFAGRSNRAPTQHDVFVANSQWTARISSEFCGKPPVVIYPAVPDGGRSTSWAQRENSFLCLGRISPEKRIECVIAIMDQIRVLGYAVRLHLAGSGDDSNYVGQIQRLCEARSDWVVFHGAIFGPDKQALLGRCRYGINACDREAFGIATAEMMKAGIIPFVPGAGAQGEIVREESLIYQDIQDAALKMDAVLKSEPRQLELHEAMSQRGAEFNSEHFCEAVRNLVKRVLDPQSGGCS